jgi:superkiller protein 3
MHHSLDHDLDAALAGYRETIRLRPSASLAARHNVGMALATLGRPEEAIAAYRETIGLSPKYVKARIRLGSLLEDRGRLDEAIELYREGIRLSPRSFSLRHALGWAYKAKNQHAEALAEFREAVRLDPLDFSGHYGLGHALLDQNLLDESIRAFRESTRLTPSDADAHHWLAVALNRNGRWDDAVVEYREALRLKPDNVEARNEIARHSNDRAWDLANHADLTQRDYVRALALAREAVEFNAEVGAYWNTLGAACYRTGHWKKAVGALQKSLELTAGGGAIDFYFLAMATWQLDDQAKARQWHTQAVEWMKKNQSKDAELLRFQAESEALLRDQK